jgi:PAS domain S-box-containing protein
MTHETKPGKKTARRGSRKSTKSLRAVTGSGTGAAGRGKTTRDRIASRGKISRRLERPIKRVDARRSRVARPADRRSGIRLDVDRKGLIIRCSAEFSKLVGVDREVPIGTPLVRFAASGEAAALGRFIRSLPPGGGKIPLETHLMKPDGTRVRVRLTGRESGSDLDGLGAVRLSVAIMAEGGESAEIPGEKDRLVEWLLETSSLNTWISDAKGTAVGMNSACSRFFGVTAGEVLGKYNIFEDEEVRRHGKTSVIRKAFEECRPVSLQMDYDVAALTHIRARRGKHKTIQVSITPVPGRDGRTHHVIFQSVDLTGIRAAEEELRRSEETFRTLVEASPMAEIVTEGADGGIRYINPRFTQLSGYAAGEISEMPDWRNKLCPAGVPGGRTAGGPVETILVCRDGSEKDVEISTVSVGNRCISYFTDLTEWKRTLHLIVENEEKLRLLVDHAPVALAMFDRAMRYIAVSRRWISDFHLQEADLIGKSHYDIFPEITEPIREVHRKGMAGEVVKGGTSRFDRADGSSQWLRWEMRPWKTVDGAVGGIVIFSEDVTVQKTADLALRESEAKLSNAMKMANLGHWELDVDSGLFTFSENFWSILHTDSRKMGGYRMSIQDYAERFVHPDDSKQVGEETRKAIEARDPRFSRYVEHRFLYADGGVGIMAVRFFILKDDRGRTIKTYGVNQDITERKRTEEQIRKDLKEKEVLLRELYHRTKNNMQVICSMINLQRTRIDDPTARELLTDIETRIYSMALVHQNLMQSNDLSRLNLKDYLETLIEHLRQGYFGPSTEIVIRADLEDVDVELDTAVPLGLVVNELFSNIRKHAFRGRTSGVVRVTLRRSPQDDIVLEISDDGPGWPDAEGPVKGANLGLQTSVALIEQQLEGHIDFENRNGLLVRIRIRNEPSKQVS